MSATVLPSSIEAIWSAVVWANRRLDDDASPELRLLRDLAVSRLAGAMSRPSPTDRLVFERRVERLHGLGPRPIGELLLEVAAGRDLNARLRAYVDLDPRTVHALGADRFPPAPVRVVSS